jgi:hypothetical protein
VRLGRKDVAIAAKRLDIVDTLEKLEAEAEALPDGVHHHFFLSCAPPRPAPPRSASLP